MAGMFKIYISQNNKFVDNAVFSRCSHMYISYFDNIYNIIIDAILFQTLIIIRPSG